MIHHFARALAVREQARTKLAPSSALSVAPGGNIVVPTALTRAQPAAAARGFRMRRDPSDARRTVITGRFAEVCAALDRMVAELEPA